ncbi:MAG: choice-of-anchor P family protein, partial [Actinomycetota bacterium]
MRVGTTEPFVANPPDAPCADDNAGGASAPELLPEPSSIGATTLRALTAQSPDDLESGPPDANDVGEAESSVQQIEANVAGIVKISAEVVTANASVHCVPGSGGQLRPTLDGASSVGALSINGEPVDLAPETTEIPLPLALGTIHINREVETASSLTRQGLWIEVMGAEIVVAEVIADFSGNPCTAGQSSAAKADFDGDGDSDVSVYRPSTGGWFIKDQQPFGWGGHSSDKPVPGDYDGDGVGDAAVYRAATGVWYIRGQGSVSFGGDPSDLPVPADYDGDGDTDVAVYRASIGVWYVNRLEGQPSDVSAANFGGSPADQPVPADYDGDGTADVAIFRAATGTWFVQNQFNVQWGGAADKPVPGDYDGDGDADIAVYRASAGDWYVRDQFHVRWGGDPSDL